MKKKIYSTAITLLMGFLISSVLQAQEEYERIQGFIVWEDAVHPSKVEEYEAATKMQIDLYREYGFPGWVGLFSTSEFIYYWVFEVDKYADVDTLYQEFSRIAQAAPEQTAAVTAAFEGTHEYTKAFTCYWDNELSYISENSGGAGEGMNFRFWSYNYALKGKMDELQDVFREWVALAKDKGAKQSWYSYVIDMGDETPCIFWVAPGRNAAEFYATNSEDMTMMGESADALWQKHSKLLRKVKDQVGWYREDLSYTPEE